VLPRTALKKVLVTSIGELLGFPRGLIVNIVLPLRPQADSGMEHAGPR